MESFNPGNANLPIGGVKKGTRAVRENGDPGRTGTQRLESIYQQKLAGLEALKKSLLHQAFDGEL
jgi:hypothetical protein